MRILVTGSRDWPYPSVVWMELGNATDGLQWRDITVVHGACPSGADLYAHTWATENGATVERHPADWTKHGKAAGPIRNQEMVDLGADLCLAFHYNNSRGTNDCIARTRRAGIPTRVIELQITELT